MEYRDYSAKIILLFSLVENLTPFQNDTFQCESDGQKDGSVFTQRTMPAKTRNTSNISNQLKLDYLLLLRELPNYAVDCKSLIFFRSREVGRPSSSSRRILFIQLLSNYNISCNWNLLKLSYRKYNIYYMKADCSLEWKPLKDENHYLFKTVLINYFVLLVLLRLKLFYNEILNIAGYFLALWWVFKK